MIIYVAAKIGILQGKVNISQSPNVDIILNNYFKLRA